MNALYASEKAPRSLMDLWCHMLASEYLVENKVATRWILNMDSRAFVVDFLKSKGWKVSAYTTPGVDHHQNQPPSHGFYIEDDCDQLISYRLTA
jgi:hypothetical protein